MRALRRITLVLLSGAVLAVACLPHDCESETAVFVRADEACPSSESVEEGLEDGTVDGINRVEVISPGTLCWYRVTFSEGRDCAKLPTRAAEVEALATRTFPVQSTEGWAKETIPMSRVTCEDGGQLLYGWWFGFETTSPGEAAAVTAAECPNTVERVPVSEKDGEFGELVGSDFVPARLVCWYDYTYSCTTRCSSGRGGGVLT